MKRFKATLLTHAFAMLIVAAIVPTTASAAEKIRIETLAIRGRPIHKTLQQMAKSWEQISDNKVKLVIYPGGTGGGEADMVDRMRFGQIQAAVLSAAGLAIIDPSVMGLHSMPFMFRNLDEVDHIGTKLHPKLEERLLAKGFVVLFWSDTGWVHLFSNRPAISPDDFRELKFFAMAGYTAQVNLMKSLGFKPVQLEANQIPHGLQTRLIDATPVPPGYALGMQVYRSAPHMLEINYAPLVGAAVIAKKAWDRIPAKLHRAFLEKAAAAGAKIKAISRKESEEAVQTMKAKGGLTVHSVSPAVAAEWRALVQAIPPRIRRAIIPDDVYHEAEHVLQEYRAGRGDQ